ncbi:hypothetical protein DEU56DRAFT_984884 [Suillus clintonianus]|uniref:uncharacterized protein n=1 Tax=Suillus clintonianus TaxID=1904413 RepID=UPI001B85F8CE|nr:uncharacterized protein DEU56DRAFT_984884 [Suillus clintonianus]KAG2116836.1 hypothetical protein DEU56DRAFT_984884 [Suillus clintonianus]
MLDPHSLHAFRLSFDFLPGSDMFLRAPLIRERQKQNLASTPRLMTSGLYLVSVRSSLQHDDFARNVRARGLQAGVTQAAHIFPALTNNGISVSEEGDPKTCYATSVCATVDDFAGCKIGEELDVPNIHRLENISILSMGLHSARVV